MNNLSAPAIEAHDLCKTYTSGVFKKQSFTALSNVSFTVNRGEIFGLLGPNGAGKTTFIKVLLGIIRSTSGAAKMLGRDAGTLASRKPVGYLPEHLRIRRHHTGLTAMEYYGQLSSLPMSTIRHKRDELLKLVGLFDRRKNAIKEYSKGMLQRLGLAQALLHDPELIILDEPTDGLDPAARADVRALLARLRDEGKTIFLNSHILQEVELICDRVAILDRGNLRYCGSVKDIGQKLAAGKGQSQLKVELLLQAENELIKQTFADLPFGASAQIKVRSDGVNELNLELAEQEQVDQLVDTIRQAGISIVGLTRQKATLEAAFLELINDVQSPPTVVPAANELPKN